MARSIVRWKAAKGLVMHLEMQFQHGRNSKVSRQAASTLGTNYHHVEIEFVAAACAESGRKRQRLPGIGWIG